jgi:hypothetical protein
MFDEKTALDAFLQFVDIIAGQGANFLSCIPAK